VSPQETKHSQKRSQEDSGELPTNKKAKTSAPLVVFGLGNKGDEHESQRHNIGERTVKTLAELLSASPLPTQSAINGAWEVKFEARTCILLPPQGVINDSGAALRAALDSIGEELIPLIVVDDCALPLGTVRLRQKGSSGGHNGLKNIESIFGHKYHRLKIGIGGERSKDHVVGEFSSQEQPLAEASIKRAAEAAKLWLSLGPEQVETVLAKVNSPAFRSVSADKTSEEIVQNPAA